MQEQRDSGLGEIEALRKYIRKAKAEADEALTKAARENLHYQNLLQEAQAEVLCRCCLCCGSFRPFALGKL